VVRSIIFFIFGERTKRRSSDCGIPACSPGASSFGGCATVEWFSVSGAVAARSALFGAAAASLGLVPVLVGGLAAETEGSGLVPGGGVD
jgi:hypothetical protein